MHTALYGEMVMMINGSVIEEIIDNNGLLCLNDGRNTRIDLVRGVGSAIDLTLVSEVIASKCIWDVWEDNNE